MQCNHAEQLLSLWLDGELDSSREHELKVHLESCPECSELRKSWKQFGDNLRASPLLNPPDVDEVWKEIHRNLPERRTLFSRRRLTQELLFAGGAAALLVISLFVYLGFSKRPEVNPRFLQAAKVEFLETGIPGATPLRFFF